jgi:predicted RNA-binding protein Jag
VYDAKNEPHEFIGEDHRDALRKALTFFGLEEAELSVRALDPNAVYGLGGRTVIVAAPKNRVPAPRRSSDDGESRGRDRDRGRGRREGGRREREGRDEGRREGRGFDRGGRGERRGFSEERSEARSFEAAPALEEAPSEPSVGTPKGTLGTIGEFVRGTIERLELGPFEITESEDGEVCAVEVTGAAARQLASGDGRAVDALALLANQAAQQVSEDAKRVVLDVEGNSDAREDFLARLAQRAVSRAREAGHAIALDPMNGRDRRIIHLAVREADGVASMSVGEGRYRQVVVVPEGAPEYDEAVRQSDSAGQRE